MDKDEGFTVRDRRGADPGDGATRPDPQPGAASEAAEGRTGPAAGQASNGPQPPMDFASLVISLAGSAQMSLGLIPNPETNLSIKDLPAAQQMIDILAMLQVKTEGNLSGEERKLLEQVLFTLRMHYVRVTEEGKKTGGK